MVEEVSVLDRHQMKSSSVHENQHRQSAKIRWLCERKRKRKHRKRKNPNDRNTIFRVKRKVKKGVQPEPELYTSPKPESKRKLKRITIQKVIRNQKSKSVACESVSKSESVPADSRYSAQAVVPHPIPS
jgi:hypothetical protein